MEGLGLDTYLFGRDENIAYEGWAYLSFIQCKQWTSNLLVRVELVEFAEKGPVRSSRLHEITDRLRRIYEIYLNLIKKNQKIKT